MKKILLLLIFVLSVGICDAANQPRISGKVFRSGETFLDFSSSTKGVYSYSEDNRNVITRTFTYSTRYLMKSNNYSKGPIYKWQITVRVAMSYGTKDLKFYVETYENGSLKGNKALASDGENWDIL
ncbi:MAG: hypothetical protein J6A70_02970 [Prevotella sp.]|nr:hypothetical protein [Prevotella sp.]